MKTKYETRVTPQDAYRRNHESRMRAGAVLILAVVLTSLLAVVGVMFVMTAQVDRTATSAISENRELNFAIETVIADISQELVLDVPGAVDPNQEYYDYPDSANRWLASLEPYYVGPGDYRWMQISDVYEVPGFDVGLLEWFGAGNWQDSFLDKVEPLNLRARIISPADPVGGAEDLTATDPPVSYGGPSDADGDGVADSRWIKLPNVTSNKGKPIFAAIRIIDNGGMLNVNTAYKFDPNDPDLLDKKGGRIDGSSLTQINLLAIAKGATEQAGDIYAQDLQEERCGGKDSPVPKDLDLYERNVIWQYGRPNGDYTPFDISDELELRYRFLLNQTDIDTRLEVLGAEYGRSWLLRKYAFSTPVDESGELYEWFKSACADGSLDPNYACRHIATIHNMDRIIDPNGDKMVNVNTDSLDLIRQAMLEGIDESEPGREAVAAQMAVNLIDYRDEDSLVTSYPNDTPIYYGFERPCIYISELAHRFVKLTSLPAAPISFTKRKSYAVELYKPYPKDKYPEPNQWRLSIEGYSGSPVPLDWSGTKHFHVIVFEDPKAPLEDDVDFDLADKDPCFAPSFLKLPLGPNTVVFDVGKTISLERCVDDFNDIWISVDSIAVPGWLIPEVVGTRSYQRDIKPHKCIRRLWASGTRPSSLGRRRETDYRRDDSIYIQAHPYLDTSVYENKGFKNIGEIGMVFRKAAYYNPSIGQTSSGKIGYPAGPTGPPETKTEDGVRIDLADPRYQNIFKYLTVWPPSYVPDLNEKRIKGRININTAPWYVIAQLPWISQRKNEPTNYKLAQAIVAYRDRDTVRGFESIGELMQVDEMGYYANDSTDLGDYPDLTPSDGDDAVGNFEERDIIFHRISNLVTVRSDVFTAYILVRIGSDGPQKRVIAILDRSSVYSPIDKVKIVALHPVPDPR